MGTLAGLAPEWTARGGAFASSRLGGVSAAPWDSLNLGMAVGDDPAAVQENRRRFAERLGAAPVWLRQVHGARVVRVGAVDVARPPNEADAAWTDEPGVACVVQVADCLPVLFASADGRAVAAAHAGWRGLAGGVLDATVAALRDGAGVSAGDIQAWLGPCIGPAHFEVGDDVPAAFGVVGDDESARCFRPCRRADGSPGWLADLPGLARVRLRRAGIEQVSGGRWCTVADASRFFSYRRDGVTGRLAAAVWRLDR